MGQLTIGMTEESEPQKKKEKPFFKTFYPLSRSFRIASFGPSPLAVSWNGLTDIPEWYDGHWHWPSFLF